VGWAAGSIGWPLPANTPPRLVAFRHNYGMTSNRLKLREEMYRLGALKLYRDDLEQIARAVAEVGHLRMTCGDWEMNDPADLSANADLPEVLPVLEMMAERDESDTTIRVSLSKLQAVVTLVEPDTLTEGVASRIMRLTSGKKRRFAAIMASKGVFWIPAGLMVIGLIFFIIWLQTLTGGIRASRGLMIGSGIAAAIAFIGAVLSPAVVYMAGPGSILINAYRSDRPSFWKRTRDDWTVGAAWALVGGVIGYLVNQIT
jgi:hypothetical protein